MSHREYILSDAAVKRAREIGLYGNVRPRLLRMARHSAPFRHPSGNRRFEGFVLDIQDGVVQTIARLKECEPVRPAVVAERREQRERRIFPDATACETCRGSKLFTVFEFHENCDGRGCAKCDDGEVRVERPCQMMGRSGMCPQN